MVHSGPYGTEPPVACPRWLLYCPVPRPHPVPPLPGAHAPPVYPLLTPACLRLSPPLPQAWPQILPHASFRLYDIHQARDGARVRVDHRRFARCVASTVAWTRTCMQAASSTRPPPLRGPWGVSSRPSSRASCTARPRRARASPTHLSRPAARPGAASPAPRATRRPTSATASAKATRRQRQTAVRPQSARPTCRALPRRPPHACCSHRHRAPRRRRCPSRARRGWRQAPTATARMAAWSSAPRGARLRAARTARGASAAAAPTARDLRCRRPRRRQSRRRTCHAPTARSVLTARRVASSVAARAVRSVRSRRTCATACARAIRRLRATAAPPPSVQSAACVAPPKGHRAYCSRRAQSPRLPRPARRHRRPTWDSSTARTRSPPPSARPAPRAATSAARRAAVRAGSSARRRPTCAGAPFGSLRLPSAPFGSLWLSLAPFGSLRLPSDSLRVVCSPPHASSSRVPVRSGHHRGDSTTRSNCCPSAITQVLLRKLPSEGHPSCLSACRVPSACHPSASRRALPSPAHRTAERAPCGEHVGQAGVPCSAARGPPCVLPPPGGAPWLTDIGGASFISPESASVVAKAAVSTAAAALPSSGLPATSDCEGARSWTGFRVPSECPPSALRVPSECLPSAFRVPSGCLLSAFRVPSGCLLSTS